MKKNKNTSKKKIYLGNMYPWGGNLGDPTKIEGAISGAVGTLANKLLDTTIGGGLTDNTGGKIGSGISNIGGQIGSAISTVNPLIGGLVSSATGLLGGLTTKAFGADFNEENIADIENKNRQMANTVVAGGSNENILSQWSTQEFGDNFTKSSIGKEGWFSDDITDKYNELKKEQNSARNRVIASYDNAIGSTERQLLLNDLANYSAHGGPIHIAPSKRGTFTAAATKHGMGVQEFARKVLANKDEYSTAMVKKANFARNAAKWHADGGFLTHGGIFNNGVTIIGNGDSHENNPYEGVQMGVDPQGIPNLVEENEVIWNDYVFSDRLKANKEIRSKYKLRSNKEMSFADVAKKISKESEERPNDPISKRGLEANMIQLAMEQEILKMKKDKKSKGNKFEDGGPFEMWVNPFAPKVSTIEDSPYYGLNITSEKPETTGSYRGLERYAPLIDNVAGITQNLLSKPDYSAADRLNKAAADMATPPKVGHTALGDYIKYTPEDPNRLTNKLSAEAAGLRNAILNSSSPSRTAALLAADRTAQDALGDAYLKAAEQNLARKQAAATFNRGTNQVNAGMGLKASMANAELAQKAKQLGLSATIASINARDAVDAARNAALNTNINQFFTGLGNIGKEAYNRNMILSNPALYYTVDNTGKITYKDALSTLDEGIKAQLIAKAQEELRKKKGGTNG